MQGSLFIPLAEDTTSVIIPVGVEGVAFISFNPCHPVYGLSMDSLNDDQEVTMETLLNWLASDRIDLFIEDIFGGVDFLTEEQSDAILNAISAFIEDYVGQPLYCPNIASHEPIDDVTS